MTHKILEHTIHWAFKPFCPSYKPVRAVVWYVILQKSHLEFFLSSLTSTDRLLAYNFSFSPWRLPHEKPNQASFPFWWNLCFQQVVVVILFRQFLLFLLIKKVGNRFIWQTCLKEFSEWHYVRPIDEKIKQKILRMNYWLSFVMSEMFILKLKLNQGFLFFFQNVLNLTIDH